MPEELPKEWFWDGDGTYQLSPEWLLATNRLRFNLKPKARKGKRRKKGDDELKVVIDTYHEGQTEKLDARTMGSNLTLPRRFSLNDVKDRYYRALVFNDAGKALHYTTPVQPSVDARKVRPAAKPRRKKSRKKPTKTTDKTGTKKPAEEQEKEPADKE